MKLGRENETVTRQATPSYTQCGWWRVQVLCAMVSTQPTFLQRHCRSDMADGATHVKFWYFMVDNLVTLREWCHDFQCELQCELFPPTKKKSYST